MYSARSPKVEEDIQFSNLPTPPVSATFGSLPANDGQEVSHPEVSIQQISPTKRARTAPSSTKSAPKHHLHIDDYTEEPIYDNAGVWKAGDPLLGLKGKKHKYERLGDEAGEDDGAEIITPKHDARKTGFGKKQSTSSKPDKNERRKRHLDLAQRILSLCLSVIIVATMSHALIVFLANQDVTADGQRIYPTFMVLWPTYLMIASAAVTVVLNSFIVYWRVRGTIKDECREDTYNKVWDYILHGINGTIWFATTTSFGVTKNQTLGGAQDPNVLFGYVCSTTADNLSNTFPQILKFQVQCEIQSVSFWMSVSAVMMEGFAVAAKVFLK